MQYIFPFCVKLKCHKSFDSYTQFNNAIKDFKIIVVWRITKKFKKSLFFSNMRVINPYLHWFELHVRFENAWIIVSLIFSDTERWLAYFIWSELTSNWRWCVICLIQLPFVLWFTVSWTFGNGPCWLVFSFACIWAFFWMVSARANDLGCRI